MKQLLPFPLFLLFLFKFSKAQELVFADQFAGNDAQSALSIAVDHNENSFVGVVFYDDMDADPGPGEVELEAEGNADIALIKLTSAGEFVWAIQLGSDLFETVKKVTTDEEGNVLICGYFKGTIDFDPGPATYNLSPVGDADGYLAKYDNDGNFLWAYKIGSNGYEEFYGLDVDSLGNVYTMGYFQNTIDFNPGSGVSNLTAIGGNAIFFWKLDKDGNFIWSKQIAYTFANDLRLDDDDHNIYVTGEFYGTVDFNPGSGTFNLTAQGFTDDAFVMKLDKDGIFQWAISMSGSSYEAGLSIGFLQDGKVLVGGRFQSTVDFDPGPGTNNISSVGYYDGFVECFNTDGSMLWVKTFGGAGWDVVYAIDVDKSNNIHLAIQFEQTTDLDPSNNSFQLTSNGYTDASHCIWDSAGNFISAFQIGGVLEDYAASMVIDDEGSILLSGFFSWITDFDPSADTLDLTSYTGWDGFAAKYCTAYTIENLVSICEGDSIFAGGEWQTEEGDYYDYYDPTIGCDSTVITHLSFNHPNVNLGNDTSICGNNSVLLDAGTWSDYLWSTGDTTQTIEIDTTGNFSVSVINAAGCVAHDTIEITQGASPIVNLGADQEFCYGETIVLNAGNPGSDYLWNSGDTTKKIFVLNGGTYSVQVTNPAGCVGYDTVVVTENPLPVVSLGADVSFCENDSIQLDAGNAGSEFFWSSGEVTQAIYVNEGGEYFVKVTDVNGCSASDTISVLENLLPLVDLGNDLEFCGSDSVLLDAGNSGIEYLWSTGATSQTIYVSDSALYSVTVSDNNGCKNSDTIEVSVHTLPNVSIDFSDDTTVCLSSASFLLPQAFPFGGIYSGDGISENAFNPIIAGTGDHVITYTYTDSFGCTNADSFLVSVVVCTQVESSTHADILIYPNPSSGTFIIERASAKDEIVFVKDVSGKILRTILISGFETKIDLSTLTSGIYFLMNEEKSFRKKIVITH